MSPKNRRREMRLAASDDDVVVEAASILNVTFSEFVMGNAVSRATRIVDAHHSIQFSDEQTRTDFFAELDAPFAQNDLLVSQARKSRRIKSDESM